MSDWIVRTYDDNDKEVTSFTIENRTEREAEREAMSSPEVQAAVQEEDSDMGGWTMTKKEDEDE